ncbi:hypothetical protein [Leptospira santarosai]|uniref:hypothetical protein n=1 Tax=Leptospira santarosai TaxID=28183 RepID=UPI0002BF26FA|nr:hypothetical protein [Leptospira santarosai]EMO84736.1 hypothetical protein LEP1GSC070_0443 [Leptospira santarosai str. AIM]
MGTGDKKNKETKHDGYSPREIEQIKEIEREKDRGKWQGGYQPDTRPEDIERGNKNPPQEESGGN